MGCPKIALKDNLSEMMSNWQISIGYEDNQIMADIYASAFDPVIWLAQELFREFLYDVLRHVCDG